MAAQLELLQPIDVPSYIQDLTAIGIPERETPWDQERFIVQSPYTEKKHLLDLETLDHETALLAKALQSFKAIRNDYAIVPYTDAFNWPEVLQEVKRLSRESGKPFKENSYYIVAFRSRIKPDTDYGNLEEMDKGAHAEAIASGGFLRYWYGAPDAELRNLATCIWKSREHAIAGGRGPAHRAAAAVTRNNYAFWKIDQHRLTIRDNVDSWEITDWA